VVSNYNNLFDLIENQSKLEDLLGNSESTIKH